MKIEDEIAQTETLKSENIRPWPVVLAFIKLFIKEPPWTSIIVLVVTTSIEIIAEFTELRLVLIETLALSADRSYTVTTYWTIHGDRGHAYGNIFFWIITSPFGERAIGRKRYATICAVTTTATGMVLLIIKSKELTGIETGSGMSIIGWMSILFATGLGLRQLTGKETIFKLGILSGYIFLATGAATLEAWNGQDLTELPSPMLGHLAGATIEFILIANEMKSEKLNLSKKPEGKEWIACLIIAVLFLGSVIYTWDLMEN